MLHPKVHVSPLSALDTCRQRSAASQGASTAALHLPKLPLARPDSPNHLTTLARSVIEDHGGLCLPVFSCAFNRTCPGYADLLAAVGWRQVGPRQHHGPGMVGPGINNRGMQDAAGGEACGAVAAGLCWRQPLRPLCRQSCNVPAAGQHAWSLRQVAGGSWRHGPAVSRQQPRCSRAAPPWRPPASHPAAAPPSSWLPKALPMRLAPRSLDTCGPRRCVAAPAGT
jgi:hypothetical protein